MSFPPPPPPPASTTEEQQDNNDDVHNADGNDNSNSNCYFLGIDIGTQGLTCMIVDNDLKVIATGEGSYGMVPNLPLGCYEQRVQDWSKALEMAMKEIISKTMTTTTTTETTTTMSTTNDNTILKQVKAIGISGQMHGQVLIQKTKKNNKTTIATTTSAAAVEASESPSINKNENDDINDNDNMNVIYSKDENFPWTFQNEVVLGTVRLWCDSRNQQEANELSELFFGMGIMDNLPKRSTIARWLWTIRNEPDRASKTTYMTTPAGWLSYLLTQQTTLGIGDASGMFPMCTTTMTYRQDFMEKFNNECNNNKNKDDDNNITIPNIQDILPKVILCGQDAGNLTPQAAKWLGGGFLTPGIPVAAAEGDQPAALVGSLIGRSGMVSCSFGTSVCANLVGNAITDPILPPSSMINHFCDANGQPIYMVWLRNGTTFFNKLVNSYGDGGGDGSNNFQTILPKVIAAPPDCGGLIALPFMDDEPGLHVHEGGTAMIMGWNGTNSSSNNNNTVGNVCKAALLATMFNLKYGTTMLQDAGIATTEIILTGGLTKTPECGQILADVFHRPVRLLEASEEGCSWGAAVLAKYRYFKKMENNNNNNNDIEEGNKQHQQQQQQCHDTEDWPKFLETIPAKHQQTFQPNPEAVPIYQKVYERYQILLAVQPQLQKATAVSSSSS